MHFLQAINSGISVLMVCNKTGGTIKGDIKKNNLRRPQPELKRAAAGSRAACWMFQSSLSS